MEDVNNKVAKMLQEELIQCCINFVNKHSDISKVRNINVIKFDCDCLMSSVEFGSWHPNTDSNCIIEYNDKSIEHSI
jgi:hypothetical protein